MNYREFTFLGVCLLSFSVMFMRLTDIVAYSYRWFILIAFIPSCQHTTFDFSVLPLMDIWIVFSLEFYEQSFYEHWRTCLLVHMCIHFVWAYMGHRVTSDSLQQITVFLSGCASLHREQKLRVLDPLHPHQHQVLYGRCVYYYLVGLICISLMTNEVEHFFMFIGNLNIL